MLNSGLKSIIDVIIPVYNGQDFIASALDSVNAQTLAPNRIIIVNDGSTDDTTNILQHYHSSIPISVINKKNGGLSSARNRGIEASGAEYIAFLDADDVWKNTKLEKQCSIFKTSHVKRLGVVYCDYYIIDDTGNRLPNYPTFKLDTTVRGDVFTHLLGGNKVSSSGSGVLIKKECFATVGKFDERLPAAEDWDMWLKLAREYGFDYTTSKLVGIRRHSTNMSNSAVKLNIGLMLVLNKYTDIAIKNPTIGVLWGEKFFIPIIVNWRGRIFQPNYFISICRNMSFKLVLVSIIYTPISLIFVIYKLLKWMLKRLARGH